MAQGKYLSLEEARKKGTIRRFINQHQSVGDEGEFDAGLQRMIDNKPLKKEKKASPSRKRSAKPRT